MSDEVSGRIMEHAWHMIFGKEPVQYVSVRARARENGKTEVEELTCEAVVRI